MFEGKLVRLRAMTREDLPRCVSWINDQELARYMEFHRPVSLEQEQKWYEGLLSSGDDVFAIETLAAENGTAGFPRGEHIGSVGLHDVHPRYHHAMLGIFIGNKGYWGRGYGSEAVRLMLQYAFEQLNLHRVYLRVFAYNKRAIRAYEKCGFEHEGVLREAGYKNGQYFDVLAMGILESEYREGRRRSAEA